MSYAPVSIQACADYEEATVRQSMGLVLRQMDALNFVRPGMTVAVKVNLVSAAKPEEAATTHPALVRELCRLITEKGARVVVGDSPGGLFSRAALRGIYQATGLHAVEEVGGSLNDNFEVRDAVDHDAAVLHTFPYTAWLEEADAIICFAKLKTHAMMGMTCAVKNMFGAIPGTAKSECHMRFPREDLFADMLIDLNEHFRPALYLVDAVEGMEGNGPTKGTPRHIGLLLASPSPHTVDAVCARLIGLSEDAVPTLMAARERGLIGEDFPLLVTGKGTQNADDYAVSDFEHVAVRHGHLFDSRGKLISKTLEALLTSRPKLKESECIGCGKCGNICPAKAITMESVNSDKNGKKKAVIDRDKCIRCFCCQEFCPKGAMKVHRPWIAKLLTK